MLCPQLPCLLPSRPGGFWSHQTPKYLIKSRKQQASLMCSPESGHLSVYWYQQALGQGPRLLVQYHNQKVWGEAQLPDRFSGEQFRDSRSELSLTPWS